MGLVRRETGLILLDGIAKNFDRKLQLVRKEFWSVASGSQLSKKGKVAKLSDEDIRSESI